MKLHESPSPNARRVHIFMAEKGIDNEYLAGDRFSIADITFAVAWGFAGQVKVVPLPEAPNVQRWFDVVSARDSFRATA